MARLRSFCRIRGGVSPGIRQRRVALLSSAAALGLCAVAGSALLSPGLVFGAGRPNEATATTVAAVVVGTAATDARDPGANVPGTAVAGAPTASRGTLLVKLPWGAGPGQVGLQASAEGLARGPEAVALAPDGRIAVLDTVNRRLVTLDSAGVFLRSIPVDLTEPRFLAVSSDSLYVLDCDFDRQLVSLDWSGATVGASTLPALDDVVTALFATDSGPCVEIAHDRTFLVAGSTSVSAAAFGSDGRSSRPAQGLLRALAGRPVDRKFGPVARVSFKPGESAQIKLFKMDKDTLKATQTADFASALYGKRTLEHLVSVDGDGQGGLVIGARILNNGTAASGQPSLALTRLNASSGLTAASGNAAGLAASDTLLLADSSFAYLGQPYVVAPDGRVIQPLSDETCYSLMVHSFGSTLEVAP